MTWINKPAKAAAIMAAAAGRGRDGRHPIAMEFR